MSKNVFKGNSPRQGDRAGSTIRLAGRTTGSNCRRPAERTDQIFRLGKVCARSAGSWAEEADELDKYLGVEPPTSARANGEELGAMRFLVRYGHLLRST